MQLVSDGGSHGRSKSRRAKATAEAAAAKGGGRVRTWYDAPPILSTGKFLRSTTTWFRLRECFQQDLERGVRGCCGTHDSNIQRSGPKESIMKL